MEVRLKIKWLLMLGIVIAQTQRGNGVINVGRGGKVKARNKYRPGNLDQQRLDNSTGLSTDELSIVNSILLATMAAEKPTIEPSIEPETKVVLGLRSGFQDIVDTIDVEKSKSKDKQNQMCVELSQALSTNPALDMSLRNYGFVASCNKQNYKNSGCYVKCQKGYQLNAKRPLVTCRCRKRKGGEHNGEVSCKWDGIAEMQCLSTAASELSRNGVRETCDRPTNQGVFTILDTWNTGLMSMISTSVNTNVSDWTLMMEWNKPVKSRKSYLWNAKLDSVSKDLTLWTIMNKAKAARDETDQSKVEFGMVIDKIEQRDYDIRDLTANVYFWNYHYPNASCWAADIESKKSLLSSHIEEITRTRMGIQPAKETEKFCYYGKYENTNVWKHSGSQYRVHGHVEFDLPVALGEWEVQLVFDDGRKMVIMETPQMVKNDRSTDGQYWSFRAQEYNQVIFSKNVKFFVQGAMWRTAPGPRSTRTLGGGGFYGGGHVGLESNTYNPHDNEWRNDPTGAVRICGIEADWASQQTQRSQLFSAPKYTGQCTQQEDVISYDFIDGERCQAWTPNSITTISKANIRRWNRSSGCEKLPEDKRLICLSILYIDGQRAGLNTTNIPYRSEASTIKDGCEVTDKLGAPLPRNLSGGFFADDGHLKITKVTAHMVTLLAWSIASNRDMWQEKGLTEWALGTLRHGVDYLAEARIGATDIVVQVGDARTDEQCNQAVETLSEFRPVLTSSRKYPASDTMGSFVAAIYASAHAFSVVGDRTEARRCAKKGEQSLDALIRGPKGLTGRNAEYETGQMGNEWMGTCYQDELAWASAWACLGSSGLDICLSKVERLLDEADAKCEQVDFENQWNWNDVRLGTRLLLAQYSSEQKHLNKFIKEMTKITEVGLKQLCSGGFERATALVNLFAMTTQLEKLDDETRTTFNKFTSKLLTCTSRNIIGIRPGSPDLQVNHKNANYHGAVLWGGTKKSKLLNSINLLLSAVVLN